MIEFRDFSVSYPAGSAPALRGIDLVVPRGQFCAVVGAGGAGKTTLAGVVSGAVPHLTGGRIDGEVRVDGKSLTNGRMAELAAQVGLVMQNPFHQISGARFSVREELAFGLENLGVERAEMHRRIDRVMADLRLTGLAERSPYEISGGQQQLLAIGSVLVMRPAVLVLDEPTSQLDAVGSRLVFDALETVRAQGVTIVLCEHRTELLARHAERVLVLEEGRLVADGRPEEVLVDPRLEEWGVAPLRYTVAARRAAESGRWPEGRALPTTLEAAVEGFAATPRPTVRAGEAL
ncbi:ABC transporter ATP-binding protein [Streptomyces sp. NPDC051180]|uniref:energy-coupling factor ABC transporter ATP-binding protein n=1 Tax=unclassified Streptomyces TaxID=2593676 RepID=UPI00344DF796